MRKLNISEYFLILPIAFVFLSWIPAAASTSCIEIISPKEQYNEEAINQLNSKLEDPAYKVLVLGRHGRAVQQHKKKKRHLDPEKMMLDIQRPLKKQGRRGAKRLGKLISRLSFNNIAMWGSHATRVKKTAKPSRQVLGDKVHFAKFEEELYYANVPLEMEKRLTSKKGKKIQHAFFWGHGKTTSILFDILTGANDSFLPTAGVIIISLKANTWEQVFSGDSENIEAYVWSPNSTHSVEGSDVHLMNLGDDSISPLD